jgi:hypothetical protein
VHRGIGFVLVGVGAPGRIGLTALIAMPTNLISWVVKRLHTLRSRQTSRGNRELCTWQAHVSWGSKINYATSTLLLLLVIITQAAASVVICVGVRASGSISYVYAVRMVYSPVAMIVHAIGLILLSVWALTLVRAFRSGRQTLRDQFANTRATRQSPPAIINYPPTVGGKPIKQGGRGGLIGILVTAALLAVTMFTVGAVVQIIGASDYLYDSDGRAPIQFSVESLLDTQRYPVAVRFDLNTPPLQDLALCLVILTLLNLFLEIFTQATEVLIMRSYWGSLWSLRSTGLVHGQTIVEGFGAVRTRHHFIWLAGIENWVMSNAVVVGSYIQESYSICLWPIPGWCILAVVIMLLHIAGTILAVRRAPTSLDGCHNNGEKQT